MLAEIFMVQLEARARSANQPVPPGGGRFVPFVPGNPVAFREQAARPSQASRYAAAMGRPDGIEPSLD
jgi:hypothetical protein